VEKFKITRVLHAGYVFEDETFKIIFDPIFENPFSVNCYAYPDLEFDSEKIKELKFDAVFISHFHDDHCSFESLNLIKRSTPIYIYCLNQEMLQLIRQLGFENVFSLELGLPVQVGSLKITPHRALEEEVDCIFQITSRNLNVLNMVDSWICYDKVKELSEVKWHLILWPFQTMRELEVLSPSRFKKASSEIPFEWIEQLQSLKPLNLIPSSCQFINESWSWYNHAFFPISNQDFIKQMQQALPTTKIFKLNSGASISLSENEVIWLQSVDWIKPVGQQDVDYEYQPHLKVPSVSEIAKKFKALDLEQKKQVKNFCNNELIEKLNKLDYQTENYFSQPNFVWRLKVFNTIDEVTQDYDFKIETNKFVLLSKPAEQAEIFWLTEITEFKLWSAVYESEALTSLYLRINDRMFKPEYEILLKEISLTEDPLIKVLYDDSFAAYQKKQLKKIRTTGRFF
jgi:hypothetical protein